MASDATEQLLSILATMPEVVTVDFPADFGGDPEQYAAAERVWDEAGQQHHFDQLGQAGIGQAFREFWSTYLMVMPGPVPGSKIDLDAVDWTRIAVGLERIATDYLTGQV